MKEQMIKEFEDNFWEFDELKKKMLMDQTKDQVKVILQELIDFSKNPKLVYEV